MDGPLTGIGPHRVVIGREEAFVRLGGVFGDRVFGGVIWRRPFPVRRTLRSYNEEALCRQALDTIVGGRSEGRFSGSGGAGMFFWRRGELLRGVRGGRGRLVGLGWVIGCRWG